MVRRPNFSDSSSILKKRWKCNEGSSRNTKQRDRKNGYVYEEIAECFTGPGPRTGSSRMVRRLHAAFQRPTNQPRTNPAQQAQRAGTNWQAKTSIGQACFTRVNCDPLATIFLVMEKFIRQKFRRQRTKFD